MMNYERELKVWELLAEAERFEYIEELEDTLRASQLIYSQRELDYIVDQYEQKSHAALPAWSGWVERQNYHDENETLTRIETAALKQAIDDTIDLLRRIIARINENENENGVLV